MAHTELPHRKDVPVEHTWNLASIFSSIDEWNQTLDQVEKDLPKLNEYKGKLGESPQSLLEYLQIAETLRDRFFSRHAGTEKYVNCIPGDRDTLVVIRQANQIPEIIVEQNSIRIGIHCQLSVKFNHRD